VGGGLPHRLAGHREPGVRRRAAARVLLDGDPPEQSFRLLALYVAANTISSLPWATRLGTDGIRTSVAQARDVLTWYDDGSATEPSWYIPHR
jgi:hypothetical protein